MIFKHGNSRIDMRNVAAVKDEAKYTMEMLSISTNTSTISAKPKECLFTEITVFMVVCGNQISLHLKETQADEFLKCYDEFTANQQPYSK